jgi:HK97 gp10 family phage protein
MSLRLNVTTTGIQQVVDEFRGFNSRLQDAVRNTLGEATNQIVTIAQSYAPVRTGALRDSIHAEQTGPMSYGIAADVEYATFVEYGTVRMLARPFMRPAVIEGNQLILEAAYEAIQEAFGV